MTGLEVMVGMLITWAVRKARRVGDGVDKEVDAVLDAGLDKLHTVVANKLGGDTALEKCVSEPTAGRRHVRLIPEGANQIGTKKDQEVYLQTRLTPADRKRGVLRIRRVRRSKPLIIR